jgi:hypothetical protein
VALSCEADAYCIKAQSGVGCEAPRGAGCGMESGDDARPSQTPPAAPPAACNRVMTFAPTTWRRFGSGATPTSTRPWATAVIAGAVALAAIAVLVAGRGAEGPSPRNRGRSGQPAPPATIDPPATPPDRPTTAAPSDTRRASAAPEEVAASFAAGYLTFRWADGPDAVRRRCRPWDPDEVDAALAPPGMPPDQIRRAAGRETDDVAIDAVAPEDRAPDDLDASIAATVRIQRADRPARSITEVVNVRVVATPAGWAVAQVSR